jgi:hypothetical protein
VPLSGPLSPLGLGNTGRPSGLQQPAWLFSGVLVVFRVIHPLKPLRPRRGPLSLRPPASSSGRERPEDLPSRTLEGVHPRREGPGLTGHCSRVHAINLAGCCSEPWCPPGARRHAAREVGSPAATQNALRRCPGSPGRSLKTRHCF